MLAGHLDKPFRLAGRRIWVAGHQGMVGRAIMRRLAEVDCEILTVDHDSLDLCRQVETEDWMATHRPEVVLLAAAKVGGIHANSTQPAEFIYDNLAIETNVIEASRRTGVRKLMMLGSSCIYPRTGHQPITEGALLSGSLEPTNQWYAVAKIAGIKLCQAYRRQYGLDFISAMPCNLYGPGDNFDLTTSHVVPALIRKLHEARRSGADHAIVWGTGTPRREFLYVDDCAEAVIHLMQHYSGDEHVNVGAGTDVSIGELAGKIAQTVGYDNRLVYDESKPDGMPRKLLDISRLSTMGWTAGIGLDDGLRRTYDWYVKHSADSDATTRR